MQSCRQVIFLTGKDTDTDTDTHSFHYPLPNPARRIDRLPLPTTVWQTATFIRGRAGVSVCSTVRKQTNEQKTEAQSLQSLEYETSLYVISLSFAQRIFRSTQKL